MGSEKEKFRIITTMIEATIANNAIVQYEYEFICAIGYHLGFDQALIDEYVKEKEIFILPKNMASKVIRLYRMALLRKNERKSYFKWIRTLYKHGMKMGLPHEVIRKLLCNLHFSENVFEGERIINRYFAE
jgi:hypothetical protein